MLHTTDFFRGVSQYREFVCNRWAGGYNDVGGCMAIDSRVKNQYALIAKSQILAYSELEQTVYDVGLKDPDFSTVEEQFNKVLRISPGKLLPKGFTKYFPIYFDEVSVVLLIFVPPRNNIHMHTCTHAHMHTCTHLVF